MGMACQTLCGVPGRTLLPVKPHDVEQKRRTSIGDHNRNHYNVSTLFGRVEIDIPKYPYFIPGIRKPLEDFSAADVEYVFNILSEKGMVDLNLVFWTSPCKDQKMFDRTCHIQPSD